MFKMEGMSVRKPILVLMLKIKNTCSGEMHSDLLFPLTRTKYSGLD